MIRFLVILALSLTLAYPAWGAEQAPRQVIYVEGGPFTSFPKVLDALVTELEKKGVLTFDTDEKRPTSASDLWKWLSVHAQGQLRFLADGYYSSNWENDARRENKARILQRIREKNDVDMIFAMGTWAGQDMATNEHSVPTFGLNITDAQSAGIIKSPQDSGLDHVHAAIEPGVYQRQFKIFHAIFQFKSMGIIYEDTPAGRSAAGIPALEEVATELGVELVRCTTDTYGTSLKNDPRHKLINCAKMLSHKAESIYFADNIDYDDDIFSTLLAPIIENKRPTFAQVGSTLVEQGVLMGLSQAGEQNFGIFTARAIIEVLHGAKPRQVNQIFSGTIALVLNLKMATQIGWHPSLAVLTAVDTFFTVMP